MKVVMMGGIKIWAQCDFEYFAGLIARGAQKLTACFILAAPIVLYGNNIAAAQLKPRNIPSIRKSVLAPLT